ncbi:MAG: GGDEF domain-containing protein, partial [Thauera sp.]
MLDRSTAAWIGLVSGVLLTLVLWRYVGEHLEDRTRDRFANHAALARDNLLSRAQAYEQVLHGGAALFAASDMVSRAEWAAYV